MGPDNINEILGSGFPYQDLLFGGTSSIYTSG